MYNFHAIAQERQWWKGFLRLSVIKAYGVDSSGMRESYSLRPKYDIVFYVMKIGSDCIKDNGKKKNHPNEQS